MMFLSPCMSPAWANALSFSPRQSRATVSSARKERSSRARSALLTGNYQLLRLAPWLLSPANPLLFRFISHKLLRLLVPLLLVLMLVASIMSGGPFYRAIFWLQILFYALADLRDSEPLRQEVQTGRYRQYICHAQRGCRACVLQFCRRAKESLGLVN